MNLENQQARSNSKQFDPVLLSLSKDVSAKLNLYFSFTFDLIFVNINVIFQNKIKTFLNNENLLINNLRLIYCIQIVIMS